ncbi:flavin reductase family protein [Streptomyces cathayae]|uniref:flavin reductase family protein n=1 Tax=Streptomyces cathayae TaxID=3031124 RepID=UPI003C703803
MEPAKVLFCLATASSSFAVLKNARRIAIHILAQDQEDIARRCATSGLTGADKLEGVAWTAGPDGVPLIPGTSAILTGTTDELITSGDHVIILIDVDHVHLKPSPVRRCRSTGVGSPRPLPSPPTDRQGLPGPGGPVRVRYGRARAA